MNAILQALVWTAVLTAIVIYVAIAWNRTWK